MTGNGRSDPTEPIRVESSALPAALSDLSHPPAGLWCLGRVELLQWAPKGLVAIVGTREATPYGMKVAEQLAAACARAGLGVVSGMARGIDAAAHRTALEQGGATIAVLGTGVDIPYPVGHRSLHQAIHERGLVVSEMEPGTRAFVGCFPRRNRIIAALAQVTVVVEAGFKSGAINTAAQALELGRIVAAVPGRIDSEQSKGTNGLIRDGAHPLASARDLLELCGKGGWQMADGRCEIPATSLPSQLPSDSARELLSAIGDGATTDQIAERIPDVPVRQLAKDLLDLELTGLIKRSGEAYHPVG